MRDISHDRMQAVISLAKQRVRVYPERREEIIEEVIESLGFFPTEPLYNVIKEELCKAVR